MSCCSDKLNNIEIAVSNDNQDFTVVAVNNDNNEYKKVVQFNLYNKTAVGKYVRISLRGINMKLSMCEVVIHGLPRTFMNQISL